MSLIYFAKSKVKYCPEKPVLDVHKMLTHTFAVPFFPGQIYTPRNIASVSQSIRRKVFLSGDNSAIVLLLSVAPSNCDNNR